MGCASSRPLTTIYLNGSRSRIINGNGTGYFKSWKWRQIKGPACRINNSSLMITQTKIGHGSFAWELTVTDNLNDVGKDTFYFVK